MECTAHFYKLNYDFSPEFADAHHNGEESENNRRYDWEDELALKSSLVNLKIKEEATYLLKGEKDGTPFSYEIPQMLVFECTGENDNITLFACSHSIVKDYTINILDEETEIHVYLEEHNPLTNPIPGVYIAIDDFPKDLM